jgi:hypothetical protein
VVGWLRKIGRQGSSARWQPWRTAAALGMRETMHDDLFIGGEQGWFAQGQSSTQSRYGAWHGGVHGTEYDGNIVGGAATWSVRPGYGSDAVGWATRVGSLGPLACGAWQRVLGVDVSAGQWDRQSQWCTAVRAWSVGGRADAARRVRDVAFGREPAWVFVWFSLI